MTNAQRLEEMLAHGTDVRKLSVSHLRLTDRDALDGIRRGHYILMTRDRVESILAELQQMDAESPESPAPNP